MAVRSTFRLTPLPTGICMCGAGELIAWKPWRQYDQKVFSPDNISCVLRNKNKKGLDVPTQSSARPVSHYKVDNGEKQSTIKISPTVHSDRPSEFIQSSTSWRPATTTTTTQKGNYDSFFIFVVVGSSSRSALPTPKSTNWCFSSSSHCRRRLKASGENRPSVRSSSISTT